MHLHPAYVARSRLWGALIAHLFVNASEDGVAVRVRFCLACPFAMLLSLFVILLLFCREVLSTFDFPTGLVCAAPRLRFMSSQVFVCSGHRTDSLTHMKPICSSSIGASCLPRQDVSCSSCFPAIERLPYLCSVLG